MKALLFSDLHCDIAAAQHLLALAGEADVLIGAGDFANMRRGLPLCLEVMEKLPCPLVVVAGNGESTEELQAQCRGMTNTHVLHGTSVTIENVTFFGIGGAIPETPFGSWSYDISEKEADNLLANCPSGGVLISHSPPKGYCDQSSSGQHLGSEAVQRAVLRCQPRLVVCGHIHASAGEKVEVHGTTIINAGPIGTFFDL